MKCPQDKKEKVKQIEGTGAGKGLQVQSACGQPVPSFLFWGVCMETYRQREKEYKSKRRAERRLKHRSIRKCIEEPLEDRLWANSNAFGGAR